MDDTNTQLRDIRSELRHLQRQVAQLVGVFRMQANPLMSLDEAAVYTGYSKRQLYRLTSDGTIPCHRPTRRRVFVERAALDDWMRKGAFSKIEKK